MLLQARHHFLFPRMANLHFPTDYSKTSVTDQNIDLIFKSLERVVQPHQTLLQLMKQTHDDFYQVENVNADPTAFKRGMLGLREIRRYFYKETMDRLATGKGPSIIRGQDAFCALFHLIQDAVAHCQKFNKNACVEEATYNAPGVGNKHDDANDLLNDANGAERFNTVLAKKMTEQMAQVLSTSDESEFNKKLTLFLDEYYPEKIGPN